MKIERCFILGEPTPEGIKKGITNLSDSIPMIMQGILLVLLLVFLGLRAHLKE